jgi:choline-glycine betaine transporter
VLERLHRESGGGPDAADQLGLEPGLAGGVGQAVLDRRIREQVLEVAVGEAPVLRGAADLGEIVGTPEVALFTTLEEFPLSGITSFVVIVLVALFFISGADAASLVMGMLSSYGSLSPRRSVTVVWGVATGAAAAILLLADGLSALQQAAIIAAAPFTLVMIGLCVSLFKGLAADVAPVLRPQPTDVAPTPASRPQVPAPPTVAGGS